MVYVPDKIPFLTEVVAKIGRQIYSSKAYSNPLKDFKKGFIDNASDIEEIYVARYVGANQDLSGAGTLDKILPTVQTQYHKQNFGKVYSATVSDQQVKRGFTTSGGVRRIADEIITQLSTGYEYEEYIAFRDSLGTIATNAPATAKKTLAKPVDNATAKEFIKQIKKDISAMAFRSTTYATVETTSKASDLYLIVEVGTVAEIDTELLATAFNTDKLSVPSRIIEVDKMPDGIHSMLIDRGALQIYDTLYNMESQRNAKGMFTNFHLNVQKIISSSNMYNVVAYSAGVGLKAKK